MFSSSGAKIKAASYVGWLVFSVWLTLPGFLWQINYFHNPKSAVYPLVVGLMLATPPLLVAWHILRRYGFRKYEFACLIGLPIVFCIVTEPAAAMVVLVTAASCFSFGKFVLKCLLLNPASAVEELALPLSVGLGFLHCCLFVLGLLGLYYPAVFTLLLGLMLFAGFRELLSLRLIFSQLNDAWQSVADLEQWQGSVLTAFAFVFEIALLIFALAPSVAYDVLRLHLPAMQYYAMHHLLQVPPYLPYANYPQSVEMLMTLGFSLAGQPAAQAITLLYAGAACLVLFRIARLCGIDRFSTLVGLLFTLSIPSIHWTAGSAKNDFALVLFILSTLLAYLRWMDTNNFRWILLATFFLSMGAGVKHVVALAVLPCGLLFSYAIWMQRRRAIAVLQVGGVFLVFGTAWFVRAWLATGNPVYPSGVASAVVSVASEHRHTAQGLLMKYLSLPWAMHFRGHPFFESASDYPMGIVLVLFIPVWVLVRCSLSRQAKGALLFCAVYLVYWSYAIPMIRYGIAPIAIVIMFTAYFLITICRALPRWIGISAVTASIYAGLFGICGIAINEINEVQLRYLAHRISTEQFLIEALPPMRSLQYLKRVARPGDRIFGFNNCALAYAPNQEQFACILMESGNWERAKAELAAHPYRFLIMPESQLAIIPAGWTEVYADPAFHVFRNLALAD